MLNKFEHEIASQLTMQDIIDYRAFLELQRDKFILNPELEKKKLVKQKIKQMIESDKKLANKKRRK